MGVIVQSGRPMTHVGRAARRREDPPLLRGEGRFLDGGECDRHRWGV